MKRWIDKLLDELVSGELRSILPEQYLGLLHELASLSTSQKGRLGILVGAGYRLARLLGINPSASGLGARTAVMNTMVLMDIIYRGPEYSALVKSLDEKGRETLALYIAGLACAIGLRAICENAKAYVEERCRRLEAIKSRIHVAKRLNVRHTSGRPIMVLEIYDDIGPPWLLSDSIDILTESIATITPSALRRFVGNTRDIVILDVGAYNGETTMRYAASLRKVGLRGIVYAVEPDPIAYRVLSFNARMLGYPVKTVNAFLGSRKGAEELVPRGPSSAAARIAGVKGSVSVPVRPAGELAEEAIREVGASHFHMRVDTEGAEEDILTNVLGILKSVRGFSVEIAAYHRLGDALRFYGMLVNLSPLFTLTWGSCDFRDFMLVAYKPSLE